MARKNKAAFPNTLLAPLELVVFLAFFCFSNTSQGIEPFVDPLPIPPVISVSHKSDFGGNGSPPTDLFIRMTQFQTKLHRDLPEVSVWGYNGMSPGPTIEVEKGQKIRIHWQQDLPEKHILATPTGMMEGHSHSGGGHHSEPIPPPDVRAVVHLHGAVVSQPSIKDRIHNNDGWPDLWLTHGQEQIAEYPNQQNARTLWYHDHAMGTTGRNVAAGLAGMYIIHDDVERSYNLPNGKFDIPLMIQSRGLAPDGSLFYVKNIMTEFYGNSIFVNGKLMPYLDVEPRKYRFRLLNASNARSYSLKLVNNEDYDEAGPAMLQIGSDSGFLENPVLFDPTPDLETPGLVLAPAERADIIIDFSKFSGKSFLFLNNGLPDDFDAQMPLPLVMLFKVGTSLPQPDLTQVPEKLAPIKRLEPSLASQTRKIVFDKMEMPGGQTMLTLNGKSWSDPVVEKPILGSTEVWELINTLSDTHPFHIHLVDFQVLDRRTYQVDEFLKSGKIVYTSEAFTPDVNELGWKDTVRVPQGAVTRIIMKFAPYLGHYVYHCHILEHEDMDMMRPYLVAAPPEK